MQSSIFFMLLLSSMALAGPIGRYTLYKRQDPSPTDSNPAASDSVSGAFFIPPPEFVTTGEFSRIATVTEPRTFEFIEDGFQTVSPAEATVVSQNAETTAITTAPAGKPTPAAAASEAIIEATGASAFPTAAAEVTSSTAAAAAAASTAAASSADNKALALTQNKFYATLSATSRCDPKDPNVLSACINGAYAQCNAAGNYVLYTQCAQPLGCFALPLENGPGISVACTSADDAAFRMGLKSGSELEEMLGGGGSGSSSAVPTSTVRSTVTVTSTSTRSATSTALPVTSSAAPSAPVTSSAAVAPTSSSSSAVPTTSSSSSSTTSSTTTSSTTTSSATTQAPVTTSSPEPVPAPTSTTAPPNNQAPVVTAIPIGERYITSAGVVITTTIYE